MSSNSLTEKRRRRLWHCPPVESPLPVSALVRAVARSLGGTDVREELCTYLKHRFAAENVVLYDSGTHALTAAIRAALENRSERIVALPAFACYDLATAAIGADARVALYDVDPETLGPDWESFETALAQGSQVVVVAPLFGYPVDWDRAERAARRRDTILIEDAAQAAGGEWKGRELGSLGHMSVLSFGRGKGWTGAGGGALLLRGPVRVDRPRPATPLDSMRAFAHACAQLLLSHPRVYGIPASLPWLHLGETRFKTPSPALGISRFSAALAHATRHAAVGARAGRAARALLYETALRSAGHGRVVADLSSGSAGCLRYPLLLPDRAARSTVLESWGASGAAQTYPASLRLLPELGDSVLTPGMPTPGADYLARSLVSLPTHRYTDPVLPSRLAGWLFQMWSSSRSVATK